MQEINKTENGRSMVEMLGTLAIIGMLSIGGVAGYRWATDKMAANEIIEGVKKRAVVASQQRLIGNTLDLTEFDDTIRDTYTITAADNYQGNIGAFTLSVSGVSKGVCDKIMAQDWVLPVIIELNGALVLDDMPCSEENTFLYVFNNDLSLGEEEISDNEQKKECDSGEYLDLETNTCLVNQCPDGQFSITPGVCAACPTESSPFIDIKSDLDDNSCTSCSGAQVWGNFDGLDFWCTYCPSPRVMCDKVCCAAGEVCRAGSCAEPLCQSDKDCDEPTPLCDTVTGMCFSGCRDNSQCGQGEFCDLDIFTTDASCTKKPGRGTCREAKSATWKTYTYSVENMNWWSAANFCQAHQLKLADPFTACTDEEWRNLKADVAWECAGLEQTSPINWCWTGREKNSCHVWIMDFRGWVDSFGRQMSIFQALCE